MQIAVLGTGAIGSAFAYQLAKAGHDVTAIARGARREQLEREQAIVLVSGERAAVQVRGALDPATPFDLVLVSVLATQVDDVLPALRASAARCVMFMFNTFEPLDRLRDAVGAARFVFGFPGGVAANLVDGRLRLRLLRGTTVGDAAWARTFTDAGIHTVVHADMHAWLRSHAAMVVPLMAASVQVIARGAGISWREARALARAMSAGFRIVRELGQPITPSSVAAMSHLPDALMAALLWAFSRTQLCRDLGLLGAAEPRMLIDMMTAAAPGRTAALTAIRP